MMYLGDGAYPKLGKLIRQEVANVKVKKPKVYEAMVTVVEDRGVVDRGLTWNQYPRVRLWHYEHSNGYPDTQIGGHHTSNAPGYEDYIFISQANVNTALEHAWDAESANPQLILNKILHEFVHWGRFRAGKPDLFHGMEAGHAFEDLTRGLDLDLSRSGDKQVTRLSRVIRGHIIPHV